MTRKLFFATTLMLFSVISFSQTRELRISPFRFGGVHALTTPQGEARGYYTLYAESNGRWGFHIYDTELQQTAHAVIDAPRNGTFNTMITDGENIIASFIYNAFRTSLTYVVMDSKGRETARLTRENYPLLNQGQQYFPQLFVHPADGFIIVESIKNKRNGYSVEHVDTQLNTLWRQEFIPSKGTAQVYGLWPQQDHIIVFEALERRGKTHSTRLHTLDPLQGDHRLTMELTDNEFTYFPTAVHPGPDGEVAITGTFYKGEKIMNRNSAGLFFLNMGPQGQTLGMELFAWRGLRPLLKTRVYDWFFSVMPEVWIHALERNDDGSFTAIGELYKYSGIQQGRKADDRYHRVRLFDFMAFNFDAQGNMQYAEPIPRPHMIIKLDAEASSGPGSLETMASSGPLSRARAMKNYGAFTYRFHRKTQDGRYALAFVNYETFKHLAYSVEVYGNSHYLQYPLEVSKPRIISSLQLMEHCTSQYGIGYIINEMNTRRFDESEVYWRGVLPAASGKMMTYEYMPLNGRLVMNLVDSW